MFLSSPLGEDFHFGPVKLAPWYSTQYVAMWWAVLAVSHFRHIGWCTRRSGVFFFWCFFCELRDSHMTSKKSTMKSACHRSKRKRTRSGWKLVTQVMLALKLCRISPRKCLHKARRAIHQPWKGYHKGKATGIPESRVDSLEVVQYEGLSCTCSARLSKRWKFIMFGWLSLW